MRKFFLTLVTCFFSFVLYGQSNYFDVVYLKTGSIIRGTITSIEQVVVKTERKVTPTTTVKTVKTRNGKKQSVVTPSQPTSVVVEQVSKIVKIKSVDGNLWVFNMDEIDKILKEDAPIIKEKVILMPDSITRVRLLVAKKDTVVVEKKKEEVVQKANIAKKALAPATTTPKILADRDPVLACAFSIIVPGLGQIYNGELGKGFVFMGTTLIPLVISAQAKEANSKVSSAFGYIALASYICNIIEAPFRSTTLNSQRAILRRKFKHSSLLMNPNVNYLYATNGKYIPETGNAGVKITFQFDGK